MVSPALEKSGEDVGSRAIRNPLHGLARGDCRRCADDRRRACVMDNHGGLTPPALALHECASAGIFDFRCTRVTRPRGLTPPALGSTCVCASQKSPFHRQRFVHPSRSGGRQPAVGSADVCVMGHYAHVLRQTVTRQRSRGREPAVVCGNASARAIPQTCGRLPPLGWRTLLQSRSPGERR
jgi:hypothetical protein